MTLPLPFARLRTALLAVAAALTLQLSAPLQAAGEAATPPTVQIVHLSVRAEALPDFEAFMQDIDTLMQDVPGFLSITVYRNKAKPGEFTLVELWRSEADHQAHIARISESGELARFGEMLAAPPAGGYFSAF